MEEIVLNLQKFEKELCVREGFYQSLIQEDDWSFVIKIHALFEAALTHSISTRVGTALRTISTKPFDESSISRQVGWLEMSGRRIGKATLARGMGLLNDKQMEFLWKLSELRNAFVHRVSNTETTLVQYVQSLDQNQRKNLFIAISSGLNERTLKRSLGDKISTISYAEAHIKEAIWISGLSFLRSQIHSIKSTRTNTKLREVERLVTQALIAKIKDRDKSTRPTRRSS